MMRPLRRVKVLAALLVAGFALLASRAQAHSLPGGATPDQQRIDGLFDVLNVMGVGTIVVVLVALVALAVRFRHRPGQATVEEGEVVGARANQAWQGIWVLAPGAVLVAATVLSFQVLADVHAPHSSTEIEVRGVQWAWEFRYPDNTTDINELWVAEGEELVFRVTSGDVVHSLFVPELGLRSDAVPGRVTEVAITPTQAGVYGGACAEFCGVGHPVMPVVVYVFPPEEHTQPFGRPPDPSLQGPGGYEVPLPPNWPPRE